MSTSIPPTDPLPYIKMTDLSPPDKVEFSKLIDELHTKIMEKRMEIREHFGQAYIAHTGWKPDEIELIEYWEGPKVIWSFRKKGTL